MFQNVTQLDMPPTFFYVCKSSSQELNKEFDLIELIPNLSKELLPFLYFGLPMLENVIDFL